MVNYYLVERPDRDLLVGDTVRVLGSTGEKEDEMAVMPQFDVCINPEHISRIVNNFAVGGYVYKKEEAVSVSNYGIFEDLKTVFDLDIAEDQTPEDFFRDLHYAAEGIRQHEALHRVTEAFTPWAVDELSEFLYPEERNTGKTTIISTGGEED